MASHPHVFHQGGSPTTTSAKLPAKDGVHRSAEGAKVDCSRSSKSSACQYPRTSRVRADASNHTTLSRLRTPTQFPAGFRGARTCTRPPHDRSETLRLHSQQHLRSCSVLHGHRLELPSAALRPIFDVLGDESEYRSGTSKQTCFLRDDESPGPLVEPSPSLHGSSAN
jgi:hypothetical protein